MDAFQFRKLTAMPAGTDSISVYMAGAARSPENLVADLVDLNAAAITNPFVISSAGGVDAWGFRTSTAINVDIWWEEGNTYLAQNTTIGPQGMETVYDDTLDPTGWVDPANIIRTYDKVARTITLTHPSGFLKHRWRGVLFSLPSPWTSPAHLAVAPKYFLYMADGQNFAWSTNPWEFNHTMITVVIADSVNGGYFALNETHGCRMANEDHEEFHDRVGTYRKSGLGPTVGTYTLNTADDAATRPGFDAGVIKDEDNKTTILATPENTYTTARIGAGNVTTFDLAASFPFRSAGSYALVNTPATGAEAAATNNRYINVYEILLPVTEDADSQKYRRVLLQPQAQFTSLSAAQAEETKGLVLGDLDSPEYVFYTRLTYLTAAGNGNTGKVTLAGVSYVLGSRASQVNVTTGATPTAENIPTSDGYGEVQNALNNKVDETNGAAVNLGVTNLREKKQTTITGVVTQIDWSLGHVTIDRAGDTNLSGAPPFTNVPAAGDRAFLSIFFKHNGGQRQFFANLTYLKSTLTLAGTSGGWDHIVLWTDDGGTNIYGQVVESK